MKNKLMLDVVPKIAPTDRHCGMCGETLEVVNLRGHPRYYCSTCGRMMERAYVKELETIPVAYS